MPRLSVALLALLALAACNATPGGAPVTVIEPAPLPESVGPQPVPLDDPDGDGIEDAPGADGLLERQPDTCGAADSQSFVGQTVAAFPDPGRPLRIITPGMIVTQEYDPARINLYTDGADTITRITCG